MEMEMETNKIEQIFHCDCIFVDYTFTLKTQNLMSIK